MKFLSVCSGIDAASVAWNPLGFEAVAFSEIEPFPSAVLAARFPNVPNLGDMNNFKDWDLDSIDILVGGTPCQSFSVAGLRRGMADPRGNLALVYLAIADEYRPQWVVWENVPGVLSSNRGRDFGSFLGALVQLGYGFAYRVLDAQFFGVPQRRRRVFVVGHLGDWRRAAAVLFERESLLGNTSTRRSKKQETARTLRARANASHREDSDNYVAHCLNAKGGSGRCDGESGTFVACTLPASGGGVSSGMHPVIAIQERATSTNPTNGPDGCGIRSDGKAYTLESRQVPQAVAFDTTQITSPDNRCNPKFGDPCHPLAATAHPLAIAFNARQDPDSWLDRMGPLDTDGTTHAVAFTCKDHGQDAIDGRSPTLRSMNGDNGGGQVAIAYQCQGSNVGPMGTLRAGNGNETGGVPFIPLAISGRARGDDGRGYARPEHISEVAGTVDTVKPESVLTPTMAVRRHCINPGHAAVELGRL